MTDLHEEAERLVQLIAHNIAWDGLQDVDREAYRLSMASLRALSARLAEVERERDEARARIRAAAAERARARVAAVVEEAAETIRDVLTNRTPAYAEARDLRNILPTFITDLARPEETDALERIRAAERERVRHMLGAMILAVEEDADEEDPDYSMWFKHWMTKGAPTDAPHCGDCTGIPMSCHVCLWDRVFAKVDACLAAIRKDKT